MKVLWETTVKNIADEKEKVIVSCRQGPYVSKTDMKCDYLFIFVI